MTRDLERNAMNHRLQKALIVGAADIATYERLSKEAADKECARKFVESLPAPHRNGWEQNCLGAPRPMAYDDTAKMKMAAQHAAQIKQQEAQVKGRTLAEALATVAKQHQPDGKPKRFELILD